MIEQARNPLAPYAHEGAHAIEVENLAKRYGEVEAVKGVSFTVEHGEVFAFLGPNGAGKTTTIRMLCTLTEPTGGRALIDGYDVSKHPRDVRQRIGLVFQEQTLDQQLTAEENLRFHAVLYGVPKAEVEARIDRALRMVQLSERRSDLVSTFSGGMARRLEIARGMLHTPAVLFLDEPTIGLDPQTRALMWEDVMRLRKEEGVTIFLTTHYMEEAEYADRIAIIDQGRIVAADTSEALKRTIGADTVELSTGDDDLAAKNLEAAGFTIKRGEDEVVAFVENGEAQVASIIAATGTPIRTVKVHRPTLEDVFLHYTGRQIREGQGGASMPPHFMHFARRR